MKYFGALTFSLVLLGACSDAEPVATSYKKTIGTPAAATGGTGTDTSTATAALLKQGQDLYALKCAGCHSALTAPSTKKGATAARITAAATISSHASVSPFPTGTDVTALEAALK
ncbi:MAG: hypothetical protein NTX25_16745 [Proteobacteria bacterium]|nr:hypothetical protein [Pseudomonadota bacterium]